MSAGAEETEFSALEKLASEEMRISLCGTVYRIEEKAEVTAFYLKDNAVSSAGGNMKESKVLVYYSREALETVHEDIETFAKAEGLTAHANSIAVRFENQGK